MKNKTSRDVKPKVSKVLGLLLSMSQEELREIHTWISELVEVDKVIVSMAKQKRIYPKK